MPAVLAKVKQQIGADAVIVHTRTYKTGGILGIGKKKIVEIVAHKNQNRRAAYSPCRQGTHDRLRRLYSSGNGNRPLPGNRTKPASDNCTVEKPTVVRIPPHNEEIKHEIGDLRIMVENLVKEQRKLHAPDMPEQLFDLYLHLIQCEVAEEIAREMLAKVKQDMTGNQLLSADLVRQKMVEVVDNMIQTAGPICPNLNGRARVVALIGPTGVGKTTTIAKIAANLKLRQNKKVGLITIDTYRIGAVDQLRMYAQIIDVPLRVVLTPSELSQAVQEMQDMDVVMVDTAGRSQNDELKIKELKTFLSAAQPDETHLVLSGTAHHAHMLNAAEKFKTLGVDRLILTKLDEAISFGVLLSVMRKVETSISYVTTGQDVPDDIEIGSGPRLARMLLGIEDIDGSVISNRQEYSA